MFFVKFVLPVLAVFLLHGEANAQTAGPVEGEEALNLDELDEGSGSEGDSGDNEPLLPVTGTIIEVERNRGLMLVSLAVLLPVAAMLLPVRRKRPRSTTSSKKKESEE